MKWLKYLILGMLAAGAASAQTYVPPWKLVLDSDAPLLIYTDVPATNKLWIAANSATANDGAVYSGPLNPSTYILPVFAKTSINYTTNVVTGGTVKYEGGTYTPPACIVGNYYYQAFAYSAANNWVDTTIGPAGGSATFSTMVPNFTNIKASVPLGWLKLKCSSSGVYYSANVNGNIIAPKNSSGDLLLYRFTPTSFIPPAATPTALVTSSTYTITDSDLVSELAITTSTSTIVANLPAAANNAGRRITFSKVDSASGQITITRAGSDTIISTDGTSQTTRSVPFQASITLISDGTSKWYTASPLSGSGSFTISFSCSGPSSQTVLWSRQDKDVTLEFPLMSSAAVSCNSIQTAAIPTYLIPQNGAYMLIPMKDASTFGLAFIGVVGVDNLVGSFDNGIIVAYNEANSTPMSSGALQLNPNGFSGAFPLKAALKYTVPATQ